MNNQQRKKQFIDDSAMPVANAENIVMILVQEGSKSKFSESFLKKRKPLRRLLTTMGAYAKSFLTGKTEESPIETS